MMGTGTMGGTRSANRANGPQPGEADFVAGTVVAPPAPAAQRPYQRTKGRNRTRVARSTAGRMAGTLTESR